jgi:hypothetical protein
MTNEEMLEIANRLREDQSLVYREIRYHDVIALLVAVAERTTRTRSKVASLWSFQQRLEAPVSRRILARQSV